MCIKYVRTGLVREAQKTRARTIHASEMCFRIEKHILHAEVRVACVLTQKKHATLFYSLLLSVRARVFCASLTSPALENTIEQIYQKHDVNYVLRQFLAVNYSPLLDFF